MSTMPGSFQEEQQLIGGCINGNIVAERQLYDRYCGRMMGVCRRYCHSREEAEDVLQEGFLKVFRSLKTYRGEGSLEGWIRKIIVNTALEHIRQSKNFLYAEMESAGDVPLDETGFSNYNAADLLAMIHRLPPGFKAVFNLFAIEGYNHAEIGKMLSISEGTSKSQYSRARAMLQKMLIAEKINY